MMIRKVAEQRVISRGPGVDLNVLVEPAEMYNAGRLYARLTVAPGAALAFHEHVGEMEAFWVAKGTFRMDDNGTMVTLSEGDVLLTLAGQCHAVYNDSDTEAELIALIVSVQQGVPGESRVL